MVILRYYVDFKGFQVSRLPEVYSCLVKVDVAIPFHLANTSVVDPDSFHFRVLTS